MNASVQQLIEWLRPKVPLHLLASPEQSLAEVAGRWSERQRFWHGPEHLKDTLTAVASDSKGDSLDTLALAALYHDVIYDPKSLINEEESARLLLKHAGDRGNKIVREAAELIMFTKWTRRPDTDLQRRLFEADTAQFREHPTIGEPLRYETAIFREFQWISWPKYRKKRTEFLRSWAQRFPEHRKGVDECFNLLDAIRPRIAIYPGSFNPFHSGHLSILRQAELIFDKVIVAPGVNRQKDGSAEAMEERQRTLARQLRFHEVTGFGGLLSEFLDQLEYPVTVVRGVRDGTDLEAEMRFARFLNELRPKTQLVWIACQAELQHVSSNAVRELESFHAGAGARYVPTAEEIYGVAPE
jgi:pantetheine-phosphate adenylyltransferase